MINGLQDTPALKTTIIWTDNPGDAAVALRNAIRDRGEKCVVRDSSSYAANSVEAAARLVMLSCGVRDAIVRDYRSEGYRKRFGDIEIIDIAVDALGGPAEMPPPLADAIERQVEEEDAAADVIEDQLASMSDDDVRTYVGSITGVKQRWNATRETMIKNLRIHAAGGVVEPAGDDDGDGQQQPPNEGEGGKGF